MCGRTTAQLQCGVMWCSQVDTRVSSYGVMGCSQVDTRVQYSSTVHGSVVS